MDQYLPTVQLSYSFGAIKTFHVGHVSCCDIDSCYPISFSSHPLLGLPSRLPRYYNGSAIPFLDNFLSIGTKKPDGLKSTIFPVQSEEDLLGDLQNP